jgi:hypothetical protein
MPDFVLGHTQQWLDHFSRLGFEPMPLAAGVEGAIYDLGGGLVAKVWRERSAAELIRMQGFYADVSAAGLPFETPEILRVEQIDGRSVTYERKLPGDPLQQRLDTDDRAIDPSAVQGVLDVLRALATVPASPSMRQLTVLGEDRPLWAHADTFQQALTALLGRRAAQFGPVIRRHLPDFDRRYSALQERLAELGPGTDTVIHGDLFGGNILVDDQNSPLAVLDFGFLTTAGDPRLDAAIAASIMNMYGPHALSITEALTERFARDLCYPADVLLIYQTAYAVATSNAFTRDGRDGHFGWCIAQLVRSDISQALGL